MYNVRFFVSSLFTDVLNIYKKEMYAYILRQFKLTKHSCN